VLCAAGALRRRRALPALVLSASIVLRLCGRLTDRLPVRDGGGVVLIERTAVRSCGEPGARDGSACAAALRWRRLLDGPRCRQFGEPVRHLAARQGQEYWIGDLAGMQSQGHYGTTTSVNRLDLHRGRIPLPSSAKAR
jgi:hypothetical protein